MGSIARTIGYADTTAPTAPTLSLTAQGTDALLASWTPATDTGTGVRYYRLYVGTTAGTLALTETFSRATTAWLISGLAAQSTRYARVDAVDGAGNVSSSAVVSGTTQAQGTGGALAFAQPNPVSYSSGQTVSLALSQYVTGGGATKLYHRMSGSLPGDLSLATATGAITGTARQSGSYAPVIRVTDTTADALEADWVARSTATGVKWAHDFRSDAEVTKYRLLSGGTAIQTDSSNQPLIRRNTSDTIGNSTALEFFTPAGVHCYMRWVRPFRAVPGDVGYTSGPDIPANWNPDNWKIDRRGLYGHPDYWGTTIANTLDGVEWAGHDFYIQFQYKVSASFFNASQPYIGNGGKLLFVDLGSGGNQELVIQTPSPTASDPRRFCMYTNFSKAYPSPSKLTAMNGAESNPNGRMEQPGGDYAATCTYPNFANCWRWPTDEWVTVLLHVVPGHHNGDSNAADITSTSNKRDAGIEVWVAGASATTYTKIWEKFDYVWNWAAQNSMTLYGFNQLVLYPYMNDAQAAVDWWRRYTQVIFSTRFIECPKVARP